MDKYRINDLQKLKVYKETKPDLKNCYTLKLTFKNKDYFFADDFKNKGEWVNKLVWVKLVSYKYPCDIEEEYINVCCGDIMKKKEILGGFEERYVTITPKDGLMSYRDRKSSPSLTIVEIK